MSAPPHDPPDDAPLALDPSLIDAAGDTDGAPAGPRTWRRRLKEWGWTLFLAVAVFQLVGALRAPSLPDEAPLFALQDLKGETVALEDFRGSTVVVNFWATWCGPCRVELPGFAEFARNNPDVVVLGLATDTDRAKLRKTVKDLDVDYPVLLADPATVDAYGVESLPTTVIVAPDGSVRMVHAGMLFRPQLWLMTRW